MKRVIVIITAGDLSKANALAKSTYDKTGGHHCFTTKLSPTGELPATHYIASGLLPEDDYASVKAILSAYQGASVVDWPDMDQPKGKETVIQRDLKFINPPIRPL